VHAVLPPRQDALVPHVRQVLRSDSLLHAQGLVDLSDRALGFPFQAVASQHLTNMRDKGILSRRKDGVHVYYSIGDERALKVLACVRDANCS